MKSLLIDTRESLNIIVTLNVDGREFKESSKIQHGRPESALNLISRLCNDANIDIKDVDEINVEEGPGSYTGLKVGASIANALSFALQKKVNNKNLGELVEPRYE